MEKFKVNDRVRRRPYTVTLPVDGQEHEVHETGEIEVTTMSVRGCSGTVKALREETTLASAESKEKSIMVHVLWDNGTLSFIGPEGLELAA